MKIWSLLPLQLYFCLWTVLSYVLESFTEWLLKTWALLGTLWGDRYILDLEWVVGIKGVYIPKLIEWYTENVSMLLHVNSSWYLVMSRLYPTVNFWLDILGTCTSRKFHQRRFCIIKFENCLCFLKMSWCLGSYDCLFCFVLDCSEYTKNVHASSRQSSAIMSSAFSSSWVNVGPTLLWSLLCVQNYGTFIDIS